MNLSPRLLALPLLAALAGCGQVPVSTQWKLRSFDALTFDPAAPRAAVIITERLRALPGGAKISFRHWRKGAEEAKTTETFLLQEVAEPPPPALAAVAEAGSRVSVFRLASADVARVRQLQAYFSEIKRTAPGTTGAEIKADVDACRTGDLPAGSIHGTLYLKLDEENGYLPLFERLDVRALASADGKTLEEMTKPCPPPGKRG